MYPLIILEILEHVQGTSTSDEEGGHGCILLLRINKILSINFPLYKQIVRVERTRFPKSHH